MNKLSTLNEIAQDSPKLKAKHISQYRLPSNHPFSKRSSSCLFISPSHKTKLSDLLNTSNNESNKAISHKMNGNACSAPLTKLPLLLPGRTRRRKNNYIVNGFKVPEICVFHSKLLKKSFQYSFSPRSMKASPLNLINYRFNIGLDLSMSHIKKALFKDEDKDGEVEMKESEKISLSGKNNPLKINLFDSIYRNQKRMTSTIRQLLSHEIDKAKQSLDVSFNKNAGAVNNDNSVERTRKISMSPPSLVLHKKHSGSLTDIKQKQSDDCDQDQEKSLHMKKMGRVKKVNWNFVKKSALQKKNTNNKLQISKYASPRVVIKNDSLVKEMLSHNLSFLLDAKF